MSETVTVPSGNDQTKPSGSNGNTNLEDASSADPSGTVAYETHRKLLAEKKKRDEELSKRDQEIAEFKREKKEREENELKAKEDYKKLLELRDKELDEYKQKYTGLSSEIQESMKFNSFLEALPGDLDKKYWRMVDTSEVVIDPSTNQPDPSSIKKAAEKFQAEFGELIKSGNKPRLPNQSPASFQGQMNDEVWDKMSPADKKKNYTEYFEWKKSNLGKR